MCAIPDGMDHAAWLKPRANLAAESPFGKVNYA